jgi:4-amino-4-deoxy-L-arabinose transferase-like glycosyltransferase
MAMRHPDFLDFYFVNEHFRRFASDGHRRAGPPEYYGGVFLLGLLPWTPFAARLGSVWPGFRRDAWRERTAEGFLVVYVVLVTLFFSASRSKLIPYVLPVWPALGVLLAVAILKAWERGASFRPERWTIGMFMGLLAAGGLGVALGSPLASELGIGRLSLTLILGAFGAGFLALVGWAGRQRLVERVALPWMVFQLGALLALPGIARVITPWPLVEAVLRERRPGDVLLQYGHFVEVMPFYAGQLTPVCDLGWSELDFGRAHPHDPALFPTREQFAALWRGGRRAFVLTYRTRLNTWAPRELALGEPRLLAVSENAKLYLLSNR